MARRRRPGRETRRSFDRAARRIESFARGMERATGPAVRGIAEEVLTDVKASRSGRGVPRDTGTLASTGQADGPDRRNRVVVSFGGPAAPYALYQHERTDLAHDLGESRYLVRGLERWEPDGSAAIQALKKMTKQAGRRASRA